MANFTYEVEHEKPPMPVAYIDAAGDLIILGNNIGDKAVYICKRNAEGPRPEVGEYTAHGDNAFISAKKIFYKGDKVTIEF